jgi:Helix-turn-helix domain
MIKKKLIDKKRIRRIDGGFAFIPHRFLTGGFVSDLNPDQLLLYFFLVLAADRFGLSFYSYDKICTLLEMSLDQYVEARCALIEKGLIAFDGTVFQVLALPQASQKVELEQPHPLQQIARNMLKEVAP